MPPKMKVINISVHNVFFVRATCPALTFCATKAEMDLHIGHRYQQHKYNKFFSYSNTFGATDPYFEIHFIVLADPPMALPVVTSHLPSTENHR